MKFEEMFGSLTDLQGSGFTAALAEARSVRDRLPDGPEDWRGLAALLTLELSAELRSSREKTHVLGIGGGQGAGKSTLAALIQTALEAQGMRVATCSLDDFYLTRAQRVALGASVHPLLETRGVPGTHDVALALRVIRGLLDGKVDEIPVFDKGTDDRLSGGRKIDAPVDIVVFEGWCLCATAEQQQTLAHPVNDLERDEDPDGRWREYVNRALSEDYPSLWELIDTFVYIEVPDIEAVLRWRGEQEQARPAALRMTAAQLRRFVAHYQRLTLRMNRELPGKAHITGLLDAGHRVIKLSRKRPAR